jgi:hypothetical protein
MSILQASKQTNKQTNKQQECKSTILTEQDVVLSECFLSTELPLSWKTVKNATSGMLRCVALVRTDVLEERSTSTIRVTRISKLETTLAVTSNQGMLQRSTM